MRLRPLLFAVALLAGCVPRSDDPRLQGAWLSNREATIAAAAQHDSRWTNASPDPRLLASMYGHAVVTYSHGTESDGEIYPRLYHYHVVERGSNYIVIRSSRSLIKGQDIRIRFVDGNTGLWMDPDMWGMGIRERYDKLASSPPRISRAQAIEIARRVGFEHNEQPGAYQRPNAQFNLRTREWHIDFERKRGDGGFTVRIDDKTGNTTYALILVGTRG